MKRYLYLTLLFSATVFAQLPGDPPADDDPPAAKIDNSLVFNLIGAIGIGYVVLKKRNNQAS